MYRSAEAEELVVKIRLWRRRGHARPWIEEGFEVAGIVPRVGVGERVIEAGGEVVGGREVREGREVDIHVIAGRSVVLAAGLASLWEEDVRRKIQGNDVQHIWIEFIVSLPQIRSSHVRHCHVGDIASAGLRHGQSVVVRHLIIAHSLSVVNQLA